MDPVIHVGRRRIPRDADVAVPTEAEATALRARIARAPLAAGVLVGLLRATEKLPVQDALFAESLAYATLQAGPEYRRWLAAHRAPAPFEPTDDGPAVVMTRDRAQLTVELNRASNRNAMNVEMRDALVEAFELALADRTIRKVVLRGRGRCFSTGGDLTEFGSVADPATGHAIRMQVLPARFLARCASRVEARVHSACIGAGIELPAFARRVVAARDAFFQLPELDFGLIPGAGGTVSIPRRIGRQRAAWLMLSGKKIGAQQALAWGLVDAIA
jgi:enoyl-CoA hydratase